MSKQVTRTRVHKYVDEEFGDGTYDEILEGKKVLTINGEAYSVEELENTNVFVRSDAEVEVEDAEPKVQPVMKTLREMVGEERLADVIAGRAVLAVSGEQVVVRDLTDKRLYEKLSDHERILVIRAAVGG